MELTVAVRQNQLKVFLAFLDNVIQCWTLLECAMKRNECTINQNVFDMTLMPILMRIGSPNINFVLIIKLTEQNQEQVQFILEIRCATFGLASLFNVLLTDEIIYNSVIYIILPSVPGVCAI